MKERHVCKGMQSAKNMISLGLSHAISLLKEGKIEFVDTKQWDEVVNNNRNTDFDKLFEEMMEDYKATMFSNEWAKRAKHGKMYAVKHIVGFKHDVDALFLRGCEDNRNKMGPG